MLSRFWSFDSIHRRFVVGITLVMTILAFLFSSILVRFNVRSMNEDLNSQIEYLSSSSSKSLSSALWQYNHEYITDYVSSLFSLGDLVNVVVRNDQRIVVAKSREGYQTWEFLNEIDSDRFISENTPVFYGDIQVGTILLVMSREGIQERIITTSILSVMFLLLVILIVSYTIYRLSVRYVFQPIKLLENSVKEISEGRLYAEIPEMGTDEIGTLAKAFQQMMENIRVVTASRDELNHEIFQRRQMGSALAEEKERLRVTLRSIGDGVITTDTDGRILLLNQKTEILTGWTLNNAEGLHVSVVFNIVNEKTREPCRCPVRCIMNAGTIVSMENDSVLIAKDGSESIIALNGSPIRDESGQIIGVVLVFRDVTKERKVEAQMQQAQRMESIGTLAGGIAHDFNNMLGIVIGNLSMAMSHDDSDVNTALCLEDAARAANQAQTLTKQLLTFSKGGAPIKSAIDLNNFLEESSIFATRGEKVRCNFDLQVDLWTVEVDKGQFVQTISNMLINAVQAMPDGGIIDISTSNLVVEAGGTRPLQPGKYVKIQIKDTGRGIPEKIHKKIFDPYFSTKYGGTGLGLATVYSIIKRHDGHVELTHSDTLGSTFTIFLPASDKQLTPVNQLKKVQHTGSGKILVVDDELPIRKMLGKMLKRMGYEAIEAKDGSEALTLYQQEMERGATVDLVILDLTIPGGMGGAETMPELLKMNPDVTAIVSSGYSNDSVMANFRDYGFKGVIPKPFTQNQLALVLEKILH